MHAVAVTTTEALGYWCAAVRLRAYILIKQVATPLKADEFLDVRVDVGDPHQQWVILGNGNRTMLA